MFKTYEDFTDEDWSELKEVPCPPTYALKKARRSNNMTRLQLARYLKCSVSAIRGWEDRNTTPTRRFWLALNKFIWNPHPD